MAGFSGFYSNLWEQDNIFGRGGGLPSPGTATKVDEKCLAFPPPKKKNDGDAIDCKANETQLIVSRKIFF